MEANERKLKEGEPAKKPVARREELKTEPPISEKDEVKKAENRVNRVRKKP